MDLRRRIVSGTERELPRAPGGALPAQDRWRCAVRRRGGPHGPGGPDGTSDDDPVPGHEVRAAPWPNGWPNGPLAVPATARDSTRRAAVGDDCGFAWSYGGRT